MPPARALRLALPAVLLVGLAAPAAAEPIRLGVDIETDTPMATAFALDPTCVATGLPSAATSATPRLGRIDSRAVTAEVPEGPAPASRPRAWNSSSMPTPSAARRLSP